MDPALDAAAFFTELAGQDTQKAWLPDHLDLYF
jgi:hypothetical protein